jgi:hypothetical protein
MPGYNNLIPVLDNSNPYYIYKGNPGLQPVERHNFSVNLNFNNSKTNFNTYVNANGGITNNDVVQSVVVDNRGVQTSTPVNADGSKNFYINFNINKQYKNNPKFIFSWNTGAGSGFNQSLQLYNNTNNRQTTFNLNNWFSVNLNFNDKVEWNSSLSLGYNFTRYSTSIFKPINNRFTWMDNELIVRFPKHFIWETQFNSDYNSNLPAANKRINRWNAALNYTMLKSEALVFRLSVFDILRTNINFRSSVNGNTVYTNQTNTLPQYFMLTATYNVRPYGATRKKVGGRDGLFLF